MKQGRHNAILKDTVLSNYFYGWKMWFRAFFMSYLKPHGVGRFDFKRAFFIAQGYRWLVWGRHQTPKKEYWWLE